jgi:DNA-binding XRE family transcriptional regulator
MGVSKNTYQKIETGKGNPSLNTLIQITNLYDLQDNLVKLSLSQREQTYLKVEVLSNVGYCFIFEYIQASA